MTATHTAAYCNYRKLADSTWGVNVPFSLRRSVMSGDTVTVRTRGGALHTLVLGELYARTPYECIYRIAPDKSHEPQEPTVNENRQDDVPACDPLTPEAPGSGIVPSEELHYDNGTRTFSAELSTVERHLTGGQRVGVRSARTGVVVWFTLHQIDRDVEGDPQAYEYLCPDQTMKLVLFND